MAVSTFKEDELGRRWDKCIADGVIKLGGGIAVGAISSLILFKRRSWPIILGSGFGIGLAYGHCERDIAAVLHSVSPKHASQKA
uniref:MICOS complex subunit MIC10 n=1 Tax=Riptortus pedestris TaxID=329032 RepID=R4WIK3_RIPPE|nr:unkown protein [Riptortus pedestris]